MKKKYKTPSLTVYGNLETITKATGKSTPEDSIIINGVVFGPSDGCNDVVV